MDLWHSVDLYCERTDPAFWSEPLNAASNAAFLLAAGLFAVSLGFRTADLALCAAWPLGTHAVWHCLNAVVLWLAATGLVAEKRTTG